MKKSFVIFACILTAMLAMGCSSKKQLKTNVETFVMPCSDCLKAENAIRVWASGTSDSETTARKKAMTAASADLAAVLNMSIESTTEEYTSVLNEGKDGISKSYLEDQCKIVVKKTISGANVVCDEWTKSENGQFTNYIVLELDYDTYINDVIENINKNSENKLNRDLLLELFIKNIQKEEK